VLVTVVVIAVLLWPALSRDARLMIDGVTVDATVLAKRIPEGGRSSSPQVTYSFMAEGRGYRGQMYVADEVYRELRVGGTVAVVYLRSDPSLNQRPLEWGESLVLIVVVVFGAAGAVSSLRAIRNVIIERRVARRLRDGGVERSATITRVWACGGVTAGSPTAAWRIRTRIRMARRITVPAPRCRCPRRPAGRSVRGSASATTPSVPATVSSSASARSNRRRSAARRR
jgi:hypothetical protein